MWRLRRWLIATAGASLIFVVLPAAALAASPPVVESESVSGVTEIYNEFNPPGHPLIDATLHAQINTEGAETSYQFQIGTDTSYHLLIGCPGFAICMWLSEASGFPLRPASIPGAPGSQEVSVTLSHFWAELQPSTTYHYRVVATNSAGTTEGPDQTFTTPPVETAPAPVIESVSISHLTPTDATLEAQIDTEGQSTSYEFLLSYDPCPECEDFETVKIDLPSGLLLPSFQNQSVSLDLASVGVTLRHGGEYEYSLRAINASGKTEARTQTFRAPPPIVEPLGSTVSPGPVSNEPEVPLADGQQPASGGSNSQAPTGGSTPTTGVSAKPAYGKPSTKHGKRRKHKHHDTKAAQHPAKSKKLNR